MRVKIEIEYDGFYFSGWQKQKSDKEILTIQGELEKALGIYTRSYYKKNKIKNPLVDIVIEGSGRTDAGVSARKQVAHFDLPDEMKRVDLREVKGALNGIVSEHIGVTSILKVEDSFHARHSKHIKQYRYNLVMRSEKYRAVPSFKEFSVRENLNVKNMVLAAKLFEGQHDFSSFRASDCTSKTTVRTIFQSELIRVGKDRLVYVVKGKGFLKQMIRIMIGTLIEVGTGRIQKERILEIIKQKDRKQSGITAPANALILYDVVYL